MISFYLKIFVKFSLLTGIWFVHISFADFVKFPVDKLCPVLYSFYASLLDSFIMYLNVSDLSSHNQHLLFSCVLSISALA